MAVGEGALISPLSYLAIGRETTLGTGVTTTSALDFLSFNLSTSQENKILEEIQRNRFHRKLIKMGVVIEGDCEFYFYPMEDSSNYMLQNAFGGSITSATGTGETVGGLSFEHTYDIGSMDGSYSSLSINTRKGQSTSGKVFEYNGVRVNELTVSAEIDDALKMSTSLMAFDSTATTNDIESALTLSTADCLSFVNGRLSVETTLAGLTTTSFWHIQSFQFTLGNSLKGDNDSRRIGSDTLEVLPVGIGTSDLTAEIRFDTTTAYDALKAGTKFSAEFEFTGSTIPGSILKESLKLVMPAVYINEASEPEIGGPDEVLKTSVVFNVLRDSTASGYAVRAIVRNDTASYS